MTHGPVTLNGFFHDSPLKIARIEFFLSRADPPIERAKTRRQYGILIRHFRGVLWLHRAIRKKD